MSGGSWLGRDLLQECWINAYASPETGQVILGAPIGTRRKAREIMKAMVRREGAVPLYRIHLRMRALPITLACVQKVNGPRQDRARR